MELVIDANIIMSALISIGGKTRDLLFSDSLKLFAPEFLLKECEKHKQEIASKAGLPEKALMLAVSLMSSRISFIPFSEFKQYLPTAKEISPDPNDTEYFALALKLDCAVWSEDKRLKRQDSVKVVSTSELLEHSRYK